MARLGLRTRLRWIRNRIRSPGGRGIILMYHRIAEDPLDPWGDCVTPGHFAEHLEVLGDVAEPVPLRDLVAGVREGGVRDGTVALTFDDGYADNLVVAKPLLEHHDVPATVFVTTGRDGRDREFWWDRLARALLDPAEARSALELEVNGRRHRWELDGPSESGPDARRETLRELHRLLLPLPWDYRNRLVDSIDRWAGREPGAVRKSHRALEPDEIPELARGSLIEVAGHTVRHPALPTLTASEKRWELETSKRELEDRLGAPVQGFAYPHGRTDGTTREAVRDAGYRYACSSEKAAAHRSSDPFMLPRLYMADCDGDTFARTVKWALY